MASGGPPPRLLEAQKNTWGGYISRGQVKYFSKISCLTPPENSRVKGGGCRVEDSHETLKFTETCPAIDGAFFLSVTHSALDICQKWNGHLQPISLPSTATLAMGVASSSTCSANTTHSAAPCGAPARSSDMDSQKAAYFWQPSYFEVQKNGSIFKQGWHILNIH